MVEMEQISGKVFLSYWGFELPTPTRKQMDKHHCTKQLDNKLQKDLNPAYT